MDGTINFEPHSELVHEKDCDILRLYLPGFKKEQLKIQLDNKQEVLIISGAMPIGVDKRKRFKKIHPIAVNSDTEKITAKFVGGILHVRQPRLIVPAEKKDEKIEHPPPTKISQEQQKTTRDGINHDDHKNTQSKTSEETPPTTTIDQEQQKIGDIHDDEYKARPNALAKTHADQSAKEEDGYKLEAENPVTKIKRARQMTKIVVGVLYVLALGMFISSMHAWFSRKSETY